MIPFWRPRISTHLPEGPARSHVWDVITGHGPLLALVIACALVTGDFLRSQTAVEELARARLIETKLSSNLVSVHKIKSRQLQYLLTGSENYLAPNGRDAKAISATFTDLDRMLANDPGQRQRLVQFHTTAQKLLNATGWATSAYLAGNKKEAKAVLSSAAVTNLLRDSGVGSNDILGVERARIAVLQRDREAAFTHAFTGLLLLFLAQGLYCVHRVAVMSSHTRKLRAAMYALKAAKRSAEDAKRVAERANRAKSDFLASVSHELRTPLNAILGFSELIGYQIFGPIGDPRYPEYAADINKSGRHLLELVNDILDLSKVGSGTMELHETRFSIAALLSNCAILLGERARDHLTFAIEAAPDLPDLFGDFKLITQIVLNLLSNAVKFTPQGGTVTARAAYQAGQGIHISVIDTGIGMSQLDIEKALLPFGQIDSKIARAHHGVGLGLPICRSYAELHDGKLIVNSVPGKGTRVTLLLPENRTLIALRSLAS